ncbi:hypothetical protein AB0L00_37150 [Actinoallomurus sp. NPDC052308]
MTRLPAVAVTGFATVAVTGLPGVAVTRRATVAVTSLRHCSGKD